MRLHLQLWPRASVLSVALIVWTAAAAFAQELPRFTEIQRQTNQEIALKLLAPARTNCLIEVAENLPQWFPLVATTASTTGLVTHVDSAAPFLDRRFYRAMLLAGASVVTGDYLGTDDGNVLIHPVRHGTLVLLWNGKTIYVDPAAGGAYSGLPKADLILYTHEHSDHYDASTLSTVKGASGVILAPKAVYQLLSTTMKSVTTVLTNGVATNLLGLSVQAVPAYNLTAANHPKGTGNGYVLTIGGRRIYISGDTDDVPEIRALSSIDVAFVCMRVPYTMSVSQAASCVRAFRPKTVYPYHYQDNDVNAFKRLVGTDTGTEVRLRKWY
jgi:L-ascorbate metabolism protein UlaG (beta-lactamase superfamily)